MLCDIFRRLSHFYKLTKYTYAGFGAIAFNDFIMFHKALGIKNMISFEADNGILKRLEANRPYNTIAIVNKKSTEALPELAWKNPHIIWLDYDDPLIPYMFSDAGIVANHAISGTALAITFQCNKAPEACNRSDDNNHNPLLSFASKFGANRVPEGIDEMDLSGWDYGKLGARMLKTEIESILASRNVRLSENEKITFTKICSFEYQDGAKMHTLVGMFVKEEDKSKFDECDFGSLDFLEKSSMPRIIIPKLTLKEIDSLERQLPLKAGERIKYGHIPQGDASRFIEFYRYLPNFSVLEN
ncbi:MAG: hypothetical protein EOM12_12040 [Verrucomicrobiae bacterium]|nr:hypothetical protein [Verrucomicrobiae bacterium]